MARFEKGCTPWNKGIKAPRRTKEEKEAIQKAWRDRNKERLYQKDLEWKRANPDKVAAIAKRARLKHKGRINAANNKRYTEKLLRMPRWLTREDLKMIRTLYELAALKTKETGIMWHVDHIIPLKGKLVSGLHVPANLQVIEGRLNIMKNNKFEGELSCLV
jgi:hypothetical protein